MSAIAGLVFVDGREMGDAPLAAMQAAAARRSFDGVTRWHGGHAGLIRFAHATTPEAVGEAQPFEGCSGAISVFDGRIDNRAELLDLLGGEAARLRSAPDGEIALALFERLGRQFVLRLAGDFAIAIWQADVRRLSLFRSAMGWRPLHWTFDGRAFGFSTEPRALVVGLGLEKRVNEGALGEMLAARFTSETDTFFAAVQRVPQGCAVMLEADRVSRWVWHDGPFEDLTDLPMEGHVEQFRALFDQALFSVTRSNGAVTSQLSGGLDSSSVVCRSAELFRAGRLGRPVGAITARFPGEPHDETPWSSAVEAHTGMAAEVVGSTPFNADAAARWCADTLHMPLRPNGLDTLASVCAALQADGRRVLLTGEGGDDWLNGSFAHWPDLVLSGRWMSLLRHGAQQWPGARPDVILRRTLYPALAPLVSARHRQAMLQPQLDFRLPAPDWLRPEWRRKIDLEARWRAAIARPGLTGYAQQSRYGVFSLGGRYALMEPGMAYAESMGMEVRHPFHDLRLTRFFMGMSGALLRRKEYRKVLLRETMRGTLPEMVRTRTTKAHFVGHIVDSIDGLLAARPARELLPAQLGWIDPRRIEALHEPFARWRREGSSGPLPSNAWGPVWFSLASDLWLRHAVGM